MWYKFQYRFNVWLYWRKEDSSQARISKGIGSKDSPSSHSSREARALSEEPWFYGSNIERRPFLGTNTGGKKMSFFVEEWSDSFNDMQSEFGWQLCSLECHSSSFKSWSLLSITYPHPSHCPTPHRVRGSHRCCERLNLGTLLLMDEQGTDLS